MRAITLLTTVWRIKLTVKQFQGRLQTLNLSTEQQTSYYNGKLFPNIDLEIQFLFVCTLVEAFLQLCQSFEIVSIALALSWNVQHVTASIIVLHVSKQLMILYLTDSYKLYFAAIKNCFTVITHWKYTLNCRISLQYSLCANRLIHRRNAFSCISETVWSLLTRYY